MNTMRKLLSLFALVATVVLAVPVAALAECDASVSAADSIDAARVVFVGEVVGLENRDRTATFDVDWVWKGEDVPVTATVRGGVEDPTEIGQDDRSFQMGVTYLVVSTSPASPFSADRCSGTRPYNGIGSTIPANLQAAVGASVASSPVAVVESGSSVPGWVDGPVIPIVVGASVVVGLLVALGRATRGPERSSDSQSAKRRTRSGGKRLPSAGRDTDRMAGWFRRSGDSQAKRLRKQQKIRRRKNRKARRADKSAAKSHKGGLRTDRLGGGSDDGGGSREPAGV